MAVLGLPFMDSHTMQGVTTAESDWNWESFDDFMKRVEETGIGHNVAGLVGQGAIRVAVKGFDSSPANEEEMRTMKAFLRNSLENGAFGLSSGLIYPPGNFTSDSELEDLASVLRDYGALYTTHMRSEGAQLIESVEATLELARKEEMEYGLAHPLSSVISDAWATSPSLDGFGAFRPPNHSRQSHVHRTAPISRGDRNGAGQRARRGGTRRSAREKSGTSPPSYS
jgi:N-acyl-D-aspartate/D-glutamate deacylase